MSSIIRGNDGFDSAGGNAVKAHVTFSGTTMTIESHFNVASLVDRGVGLYTVNLTTPIVDASYAVTGTSGGATWASTDHATVTKTTSQFGVTCRSTAALIDSGYISVVVIR